MDYISKTVSELRKTLTAKIDELDKKIEHIRDNTILVKYIQEIVPDQENEVKFKELELSRGHYILEVKATFSNNTQYYNDCGVVLGLYEEIDNKLLTTGNYSWYGVVNGSQIVSAYQTVFIKYVLNLDHTRSYRFYIKPIDIKNCCLITNDDLYTVSLSIF